MQMSSEKLVVKATNLNKVYNIYNKPIDRLKQVIIPRLMKPFNISTQPYYREFWALHDLNLEVKKGEVVGIIGRNGSGKSTLLQMICGTLTPTSGEIKTQGRIAALLELGSGFNPEFSGRENVFLNGAILGLSQEEIESRFDDIADFADIGEFIEQPVKFYSSGMMVRLAFAVQAMVDPDILIVDEALAVGDERFQRKCFRRLEELRKLGTSILFVSHAAQQIVELCDRTLLIEQGRRILFGDPLTVVKAYQKLIYANSVDQVQLIQECMEVDRSDNNVKKINLLSISDNSSTQNKTITQKNDDDFFEEGMLPESIEIYPSQGARIDSIKIYNNQHREVNNLLAGQVYSFELCGAFFEDRKYVHINININSSSFTGLAGLSHPRSGKNIQEVKRGQRFRLVHKVIMSLTPNIYFVGGGIWASAEPILMHRVLDFTMFRVLPKPTNYSFGYVDLTIGEAEFEIF